jgi:predicted nuclease of restriction endonuclease-like (RecB) superfamily
VPPRRLGERIERAHQLGVALAHDGAELRLEHLHQRTLWSSTNAERRCVTWPSVGSKKRVRTAPIVCCQILQLLLQNLPWAHLCTIMDKAAEHRDWYARAAVEYGWSRPILVMQIETGAHDRFGKATTNFERTLPKPRSDLARETLKDP